MTERDTDLPARALAPPIILDIEASGFGPLSYPIEVGFVTACGERYCRLLKPLPDWLHWSEEAESLHGISRELLYQRGHAITEVCDELNQWLQGQTVYTDGWVVDYPWLIKLFHSAGRAMRFRVSSLDMILSEQQMALWHETKNRLLNASNTRRHRASTDAELIQQVFMQTRDTVVV